MGVKAYQFIGVASGWGAQIRSCEEGPQALHNAFCDNNNSFEWKTVSSEKEGDLFSLINSVNRSLTEEVHASMSRGFFPVVIGGDHSIAVGTWNAVRQFYSEGDVGLIWIDAHMDSHTPETTPSGAWHGMPLAALLGYGDDEFKINACRFLPENICLIGVRSFEEGEAALLKGLNVRIYLIEEVHQRGFTSVLQEAIAYVSEKTISYGISLDVDVVDPQQAPGVGSPEPNGLHAEELLQGLNLIKEDPRLVAFELVEFNPQRDLEGKTCQLCLDILSKVTHLSLKNCIGSEAT